VFAVECGNDSFIEQQHGKNSTGSGCESFETLQKTLSTAPDPVVVVLSTACERPIRTIPHVSINLLELNSAVDTSGQPGAVHSADEAKPKAVSATAQKGGLNGAAPCVGTDCRIVSRARAWQLEFP